MSAPVLILQHVRCEPAAAYADVLARRGIAAEVVMIEDGDELPDWRRFGAVIAMGAPMSVAEPDGHPWIGRELELIRAAVDAGRPYWGVCFGAQLLAEALGGRVHAGPVPEVGVLDVELTEAGRSDPVAGALPGRFGALQWHSDTFTLPPGADLLASSPAYPNQMFRVGAAYGLQFHLEAPAALLEDWLAIPEYAASLRATLGPDAGPGLLAAVAGAPAMLAQAEAIFERWLDEHLALP